MIPEQVPVDNFQKGCDQPGRVKRQGRQSFGSYHKGNSLSHSENNFIVSPATSTLSESHQEFDIKDIDPPL